MTEQTELQRFVTAQDAVYADVVAELNAARKTSHWMWFVFPQLPRTGSQRHGNQVRSCVC